MNTTYDIGQVRNVNAEMQAHLDNGGKLELVITRSGPNILDWYPAEPEPAEELKAA